MSERPRGPGAGAGAYGVRQAPGRARWRGGERPSPRAIAGSGADSAASSASTAVARPGVCDRRAAAWNAIASRSAAADAPTGDSGSGNRRRSHSNDVRQPGAYVRDCGTGGAATVDGTVTRKTCPATRVG